MSNKVQDIDIKSQTCYFFNDIINITFFDLHNIKIDKKSYKNILIYYIGYVTIKDSKYVNIYSVNPSQLILNKMNTLKKSVEINIEHWFILMKAEKKVKDMKNY